MIATQLPARRVVGRPVERKPLPRRRKVITLFLALALASTLTVTGCTLHLPDAVRNSPYLQQLYSVRVLQPLGFTYMTSLSFLSGAASGQHVKLVGNVSCGRQQVRARVFYTKEGQEILAENLCTSVVTAIQYMEGYGDISAMFEYQAVIIEQGVQFETRNWSVYPIEKLKPLFAFHVASSGKLRAAASDVFAHEYVHMYMGIIQNKSEVSEHEEHVAHLAGVCAQLHGVGALAADTLPGSPIDDGSIPTAIVRSTDEGHAVRQDMQEYLIDGHLAADSPGGRSLSEKCHRDLLRFFEMNRKQL